MNYQKIYNQIIYIAQNRALEGYCEKHHIIPKCMGGTNNKSNIVKVTGREHFICHQLLCQIHPNDKGLRVALCLMCMYKNKGYKISSKLYEKLKIENSERMKGNKNGVGKSHPAWNKGKSPSPETKQKMKESRRRRKKESPETILKRAHSNTGKKRTVQQCINISNSIKGRKLSDEHKKKISIAHKGKTRIFNEIAKENIRKPQSKIVLQFTLNDEYISEFRSCSDAGRVFGKSCNDISTCARGKQKTAYGYKWKFK